MVVHNPGEQERYPASEHNPLGYLLYLPSGFNDSPEKQWPVLCFLHGGGEAARNKAGEAQPLEALLNHGSPPWHCEMNSPLVRDFIVLSPQLPARGRWTPADFEKVEMLLRTVYADFRGDSHKTFLTGFSYGAEAVFDFALWAEELTRKDASRRITFDALWPVDEAGATERTDCPVQRIWLHFGTWKPELQKRTAANLGLKPAAPFRSGHPRTDGLFTDYTPFGYDHVATCAASYADWRVYEWLLNLG